MANADTPEAELISTLAAELAEEVAKRYRIEAESARETIAKIWATDRPLWQQAAGITDPQKLKRTRAYKNAATKAKSEIYYGLRRYRSDDDALGDAVASLRTLAQEGRSIDDADVLAARDTIVRTHVSTRERLPDLDAFFDAFFSLVPEPASILDIGCGVHPLVYPFHGAGNATRTYVAIDRDAKAIEAVQAWGTLLGENRLEGRLWSLSDGFAGIHGTFDLAVALKLVPVVARQERELLPLLKDVPSRRLLVTGATQAMVKRHSIERREERTLRAFAEANGFAVAATFEIESEIGLLLEKR